MSVCWSLDKNVFFSSVNSVSNTAVENGRQSVTASTSSRAQKTKDKPVAVARNLRRVKTVMTTIRMRRVVAAALVNMIIIRWVVAYNSVVPIYTVAVSNQPDQIR